MSIISNLILTHQINKFYEIFSEVIGYKLTIKGQNLRNRDLLAEILYDISEALDGFDYEEADEMYIWLTELFRKVATLYDKPQKNYTAAIVILLAVATFVGGFIFGIESHKTVEVTPTVESTRYTAYGRYYTDGTVITDDGNIWDYSTDTISDKTPYDNMPIWIGFDDNGTPDEIHDDIILGAVYDRETAIYDALETALADEFELERNDNNIQIKEMK